MSATAARTRRRWWTRERVIAGLRLFFEDHRFAPTSKHEYHRLASAHDLWQKGARRRYPPHYLLLFYWSSMRDAWLAAGVESREHAEATERIKAWGLRVMRNRMGERHGSLVVVGLAGFRVREYRLRTVRIVLWRCRCDCGRERVVEAGVIGSTRPVTSCLACARARTTAAGTAALARLWLATAAARGQSEELACGGTGRAQDICGKHGRS